MKSIRALRRREYLDETGRKEASELPPKFPAPRRNYDRNYLIPFDEKDRHPLDEPYNCGFDPFGKSLKACAEHWRKCKDPSCQRVSEFHLWLQKYLRSIYGM